MKKEGIYLENKTIPQQFVSKCIRSEMISSSFNKLYSEYIIKERMETEVTTLMKKGYSVGEVAKELGMDEDVFKSKFSMFAEWSGSMC